MALDALDLVRHSERSNSLKRIHDTLVVQYARIIEIIDSVTVVVESVVQSTLLHEVYTIRLLSLSSASMEVRVEPEIGDTVLVLFVQKYDQRMFSAKKTIQTHNPTGYNAGSGVGILMSTAKQAANMTMYANGELVDFRVKQDVSAEFDGEVSVGFCRTEEEEPITVIFDENRPLFIESDKNSSININSESSFNIHFKNDISIASDGKIFIGNNMTDLCSLLKDLVTEIKNLQTFGAPPMHAVHPSSVAALTIFEQKIDALLGGN